MPSLNILSNDTFCSFALGVILKCCADVNRNLNYVILHIKWYNDYNEDEILLSFIINWWIILNEKKTDYVEE